MWIPVNINFSILQNGDVCAVEITAHCDTAVPLNPQVIAHLDYWVDRRRRIHQVDVTWSMLLGTCWTDSNGFWHVWRPTKGSLEATW